MRLPRYAKSPPRGNFPLPEDRGVVSSRRARARAHFSPRPSRKRQTNKSASQKRRHFIIPGARKAARAAASLFTEPRAVPGTSRDTSIPRSRSFPFPPSSLPVMRFQKARSEKGRQRRATGRSGCRARRVRELSSIYSYQIVNNSNNSGGWETCRQYPRLSQTRLHNRLIVVVIFEIHRRSAKLSAYDAPMKNLGHRDFPFLSLSSLSLICFFFGFSSTVGASSPAKRRGFVGRRAKLFRE